MPRSTVARSPRRPRSWRRDLDPGRRPGKTPRNPLLCGAIRLVLWPESGGVAAKEEELGTKAEGHGWGREQGEFCANRLLKRIFGW